MSTPWYALRCLPTSLACATIASPFDLRLPPLPISTLCGGLPKAASLMATRASRLAPFSCLKCPSLLHMHREVTSECDTCCKVLQLLRLSAVVMASLLPLHPSNCLRALGLRLPALLQKINMFGRLTLRAAVHRSCSTKASGPMRQTPVTFFCLACLGQLIAVGHW